MDFCSRFLTQSQKNSNVSPAPPSKNIDIKKKTLIPTLSLIHEFSELFFNSRVYWAKLDKKFWITFGKKPCVPVDDPGSPTGGRPSIIWAKFAENYMKMKTIGWAGDPRAKFYYVQNIGLTIELTLRSSFCREGSCSCPAASTHWFTASSSLSLIIRMYSSAR